MATHPSWTLSDAVSWVEANPSLDEQFFEWECFGPKLPEYLPYVRKLVK